MEREIAAVQCNGSGELVTEELPVQVELVLCTNRLVGKSTKMDTEYFCFDSAF